MVHMQEIEKGSEMTDEPVVIEKTPEERLREATEYVERAKVEQKLPTSHQCIDGRTKKENLINSENQKEVSLRPGGAAGLSMIMLKLGYTVDLAYESVFAFLQSRDIPVRYGWHTDHHSSDHNQADRVINTTATHQGICLEGDHNEQFVLLIQGNPGWSVLPLLDDGGSAFVYDQAVDEVLLDEFAQWFNREYTSEQPLEFDGLKKARDEQDMMTLRLLAAGKEIYTVNFDSDGESSVALAGVVARLTEAEQALVDQRKNTEGTTGCGHFERGTRFPEWYNQSGGNLTRETMKELYRRIQTETGESV